MSVNYQDFEPPGWVSIVFPTVLGLFASIVAALFTLLSARQDRLYAQRRSKRGEQTLEPRVERLREALAEAVALISQIEDGIQDGQERTSQLQAEIDQYEKVAAVSREQAEAMSAMVHSRLAKEQKKAFWQGVAVNFLFFVLGVVVTFIFA